MFYLCLSFLASFSVCFFLFSKVLLWGGGGDLWHLELLGQGSDPSCNLNLSLSWGNAGSLTHCAGLGIKPISHLSHNATDPVCHSKSSIKSFLKSPNYLIDNYWNQNELLEALCFLKGHISYDYGN